MERLVTSKGLVNSNIQRERMRALGGLAESSPIRYKHDCKCVSEQGGD